MAVRHYPVIIERGESVDGCVSFGAFFPDLPGCTSGGDTINQAILGAEEALAGHVALMVRDGDALPDPTPLGQIGHDPEVIEVTRSLVQVEIPAKSDPIARIAENVAPYASRRPGHAEVVVLDAQVFRP